MRIKLYLFLTLPDFLPYLLLSDRCDAERKNEYVM
nr:MAG TPA: hypothetical protein [Caudoviricetes sp.]